MRLRGREMNVSPILAEQTVKYDKAKQRVGMGLFNVILRGDDGTLRRSIVDQLQKNSGRSGVYDFAVILDKLSKTVMVYGAGTSFKTKSIPEVFFVAGGSAASESSFDYYSAA